MVQRRNAWRNFLVGLALVGAVGPVAVGAEWEAKQAPLMTRWAKDVSPDNVWPEYPRPQMVRADWLNLNGVWQYAPGVEGKKPTMGKDLGGAVLVPFPVESALSGVMRQMDRVWYRRTFTVPQGWAGKRVLLHFGAVDWGCQVYVNKKKMGIHRGGYDPFSYDITDALKKDGGDQEIVVSVWDPSDAGDQARGKQMKKPHGIWYTPATGIWQTVWLEPVSASHIDDLKIVPDVDNKCVRVTPTVKGGAEEVTVKVLAGGKEIATKKGAAGSEIVLPVSDAHLWSPEDPYLYDLQVSAGDDSVKSYFGMRKIEVKKDEKGVPRILLNGKAVFEVGMLDQGFWPDGIYTAPTEAAMKFDIVEQKKLGFNLIRKHVKVEPARWYYWTDKLGMLVWQDMPSANNKTEKSKEQYEAELKRLIESHWNHPSIIMWVVFNEGWGQYDTPRVTEQAKKLDPTRLVNNASGWTDAGAGDVIDMHLYPGPGCPTGDGKRAAVLGEFGGLGLLVPGHQWWDKHFNYAAQSSPEELTEQYTRLLSRAWQLRGEGLNAVVYTQTTDVEGENNGLMTYDRILKADPEKLRLATTGEGPRIETVTIAPTALDAAVEWHYTTDKPASEAWTSAGFDDAQWKVGAAGFGTGPRPVGTIRTEWKTPDIWARREFDLPSDVKAENLRIALQHDDGCEVYLNGELAVRRRNSDSSYEELPIRKEALATLKMGGKNVLAVHCKNDGGPAYIDVGVVRLVEKPNTHARDEAK